MKILVDTNILIDFLRIADKTHSTFFRHFQEHDHIPAIALLTVSEMYAGQETKRSMGKDAVDELVDQTEIIVPNIGIARKTGEIMRDSTSIIKFQDAQIAATALVYDLPVLTFNTKGFKRVRGVRLVSFR